MNRHNLLILAAVAPCLQHYVGCVPNFTRLDPGGGGTGALEGGNESGAAPVAGTSALGGGAHGGANHSSATALVNGSSGNQGGASSSRETVATGGTDSRASSAGATSSSQPGGASPQGGTSSTSPAPPPTQVNGAIEALGNNVYRITYDFENASELGDWVIPDDGSTAPLSITDGQLVVAVPDAAPNNVVAIAQFRWPMRTQKLSATSVTVSSRGGNYPHTNFYLATIWDGGWAPKIGYGCVFTTRRFFAMSEDGAAENLQFGYMNELLQPFLHTITLNATELRWETEPADPAASRGAATFKSVLTSFYSGSARYLYVGGYESSNRFEKLVIEGVFGS